MLWIPHAFRFSCSNSFSYSLTVKDLHMGRDSLSGLVADCLQVDEDSQAKELNLPCSLIPNVAALENHLASFCQVSRPCNADNLTYRFLSKGCGADEVVLFERATFLVISHSTQKAFRDVHRCHGSTMSFILFDSVRKRFEKISNIIKQFKLSCSKSQAQFNRMQVCHTISCCAAEGLMQNSDQK